MIKEKPYLKYCYKEPKRYSKNKKLDKSLKEYKREERERDFKKAIKLTKLMSRDNF